MANFYSCETWFKEWDGDVAIIEGKIKADSSINKLTFFLYEPSSKKKWRRFYDLKLYKEFSWTERFTGLKPNKRYEVYFYEGKKDDFDPYNYDWKCYTSFRTKSKPSPEEGEEEEPTPTRGSIKITGFERSGSLVKVKLKLTNLEKGGKYWVTVCEGGEDKGIMVLSDVKTTEETSILFLPDSWSDKACVYLWGEKPSAKDYCNGSKAIDNECKNYDLEEEQPTPVTEIMFASFEGWEDSKCKIKIELSGLYEDKQYRVCIYQNDKRLYETSFWGTSSGEKELTTTIKPDEVNKNVEILLFRDKTKCYKPSDYLHIVYTACYIPQKAEAPIFGDIFSIVTPLVSAILPPALSTPATQILNVAENAGSIAEQVGHTATVISDTITKAIEDNVKKALESGFTVLSDVAVNVESVFGVMRDLYNDFFVKFLDEFKSTMGGVYTFLDYTQQYIYDIMSYVLPNIANVISDSFTALPTLMMGFVETFEKGFVDIDDVIYPDIRELPIVEYWRSKTKKYAGEHPLPLATIGMLVLGSGVGTGIGMAMGGFGRDIQNWMNENFPHNPLPVDIASFGLARGDLSYDKFEKYLKQEGFDVDKHKFIFDYYKPKLSPSEILTAWTRKLIDDATMEQMLKEHGFTALTAEVLKELHFYYPSPTDFIRFAVREVFTDDEETKKALYAEFPQDIVEYAEKAGMKEDVLKWYWAAHWELPSPTQVYEMLHRLQPDVLEKRKEAYAEMGLEEEKLKTDLETVKFYLRQADYDLRWRDRLLAISFSPLTRVDLRRVYQLGLIDREELIARLMEVGYTKKDAELLAVFYDELKLPTQRQITRTVIKRSYQYGFISRAEAINRLKDYGYTEEDAELFVDLWDYELAEKDLKDAIDLILEKYEHLHIDRDEAISQLKALGLTEEKAELLVLKKEPKRVEKEHIPSIKSIQRWLRYEIIDETKARELLKLRNIKDEYIDYYIEEAKRVRGREL
ncbi:MAG: hypothetical protein OCU22_09310 [Canidatus Methanoxibalbensis ujae]|nr:hypothetical protein [Candidatus Methanoxibalbensis ujae]